MNAEIGVRRFIDVQFTRYWRAKGARRSFIASLTLAEHPRCTPSVVANIRSSIVYSIIDIEHDWSFSEKCIALHMQPRSSHQGRSNAASHGSILKASTACHVR